MQRALGLQREILFRVFNRCPADVQKEVRIAVWLGCSEVRSTCGVENRDFVWKRYLGQQEEESRSHLRVTMWLMGGANCS